MSMTKIKSKQIDLNDLSVKLGLDSKASINDPTFTGTVNIPAVAEETNTQAATVGYVDSKFNDLLGDTSTIEGALDTIKELETAIGDNKELIEALQNAADADTTYDLIGSFSATNGNASISIVSSKNTAENPDEDIIKITGTNNVSVTSDATGNLFIDSPTDATLAKSGVAADAKAVGDALASMIYVQSETPEGSAPIGAIWIDTSSIGTVNAEEVSI